MPLRNLCFIPAVLALLTAAACRDAKIVSYSVPKETAPAAVANTAPAGDPHAGLGIAPAMPASAPDGSDMATTPVPTATGGDLSWTAPASWQTRPASAMRKATFIISDSANGEQAELAVTAFPGDVGGLLANVNRWRNQLQLPPIEAATLHDTLTHLDVNGLHVDIVELISTTDTDKKRVVGAIIPFNGATWFFKLTGPDAFVAAQKADFLGFIQTINAR